MPKSHLPRWLHQYVKEADIKKIEEAVRLAETGTTGEIVPMIVHRSSLTSHIPVVLFLALSVLFFALQPWSFHWSGILIFLLLGLGSFFAEKSDLLCRFFNFQSDLQKQVEQRAIREFYDHRVHHTHKASGILIFISVMERQAVILGDKPIATKISQERWDELLSQLIQKLKARSTLEGLSLAITECGQILKSEFPVDGKENPNEICNQLIIKE